METNYVHSDELLIGKITLKTQVQTFASMFSAPMAIPAWASPPIKGWLPALSKGCHEEGIFLFFFGGSKKPTFEVCLPQVHDDVVHVWCRCDPGAQ